MRRKRKRKERETETEGHLCLYRFSLNDLRGLVYCEARGVLDDFPFLCRRL